MIRKMLTVMTIKSPLLVHVSGMLDKARLQNMLNTFQVQEMPQFDVSCVCHDRDINILKTRKSSCVNARGTPPAT